jgi:drug/metabolite transporter (DMT)-like permease
MTLSTKWLGILCVMGAVTFLTTQDMVVKWLSGDYPLHQIIFVRGILAMFLIGGILVPLEGGFNILRTGNLRIHAFRGLIVVTINTCFFAGLASLPLGEATAIFFVAPLFITALSVPFLGERVGLHRWLAVSLGLAGVIIMIKPGAATFQFAALLPLIAALGYAMLQITTRKLGVTEKAATMAFYIQLTMLTFSGCVGLVAGDGRFDVPDNPQLHFLLKAWVMPPTYDLLAMLAVGALNAIGGYFMVQAYRMAEAALVAPFEYVAMPMAVFWSVLIWRDWPDTLSWLGIAMIASAGLYVFYRETFIGRAARRKGVLPRNN